MTQPEAAFEHVLSRAVYHAKGRAFEDFTPGQTLVHHWSRTFTEDDTIRFSTETLHYNPIYFSRRAASAAGHARMVVNPYLILATAIGLSVEDLSEAGGPFVGIDEVQFLRPVLVGETISASSSTLSARASESKPAFGVVTWRTEAQDDDGAPVLAFVRSNLVLKREPQRRHFEKVLGHERFLGDPE